MESPRDMLLVGATGLVGRACLRLLLKDGAFDRVVVATRRPLPSKLLHGLPVDKLNERVIDFGRLRQHADLTEVDEVICALGTTIKKAGSKAAFREVDYEYPLVTAQCALERGARGFRIVSAMGADPKSIFFYNRVKGELEAELRTMSFAGVTILRPSLLLGERDEFRLGEEIAKRLTFLIPPKYKPIAAEDVARALVSAAMSGRQGIDVVESRDIETWHV